MHRSLFVLALVLAAHGLVVGQTPLDALGRVQEIKLLESDRDDVRRLLADYVVDDDDGHFQRFSLGDLSIRVFYSSGNCSEDPEDDDASEIWKIAEWKVTRVEVEPAEAFAPESVNLDLKGFIKEQQYAEVSRLHTQHNKKLGIAFETNEDGIYEIILFPPSGNEKRLCKNSELAKKFYSTDSWFGDTKLEDRHVCNLQNLAAHVNSLDLSATRILATSNKTISVTTTAVDPENDVLTYNYTISGGQIRGSGAKVVWDLSGAPRGTYTITAGVDDGMGVVGKTETKSVVIE